MSDYIERLIGDLRLDGPTTLQERFALVIDFVTTPTKRWKELEDLSGIGAHSWQKAFQAKQRPTAEMLEALGREAPEFAFWLLTGITDHANGHHSPVTTWPYVAQDGNDVSVQNGPLWKDFIELKETFFQARSATPGPQADEAQRKLDELLMRVEARRKVEKKRLR